MTTRTSEKSGSISAETRTRQVQRPDRTHKFGARTRCPFSTSSGGHGAKFLICTNQAFPLDLPTP